MQFLNIPPLYMNKRDESCWKNSDIYVIRNMYEYLESREIMDLIFIQTEQTKISENVREGKLKYVLGSHVHWSIRSPKRSRTYKPLTINLSWAYEFSKTCCTKSTFYETQVSVKGTRLGGEVRETFYGERNRKHHNLWTQ